MKSESTAVKAMSSAAGLYRLQKFIWCWKPRKIRSKLGSAIDSPSEKWYFLVYQIWVDTFGPCQKNVAVRSSRSCCPHRAALHTLVEKWAIATDTLVSLLRSIAETDEKFRESKSRMANKILVWHRGLQALFPLKKPHLWRKFTREQLQCAS
jgi:hypothetical protein